MEPEEPCPYYTKTTIDDRLVDLYCEVGPAGHDGDIHIGVLSYTEHLSERRAWRIAQNQEVQTIGEDKDG